MPRVIIAIALAAGLSFLSVSPAAAAAARNYDCSKAGNANKSACKGANKAQPTKAAPVTRTTTTATKTTTTSRNYDCTKWYNKARAQCRTATASSPAKTTIAPAPKPAAAPAKNSTAANEKSSPTGATALCKDGSYSHAKSHQGACSRHGGVAKWM